MTAPLTQKEADSLRRMSADEVRTLAVAQRSLIAEGLRRAKEARTRPGKWLEDGVAAADKQVAKLLAQGDATSGEPARSLFDMAYREARTWAIQVEIPVNLDRFEEALHDNRTLLDLTTARWKPYDQDLRRIRAYLSTGDVKEVGVNATPESIARLIKTTLPGALSEELALHGGSYEMAWTTFTEEIKELAQQAAQAVKDAGNGVFWLLLAGAALLFADGYRKRGRR